ncbi:hypothetical protein [Limosilactobacillus antri]|uniref:Exonuclease n=1 Tax=Limosilactobacillus antri DSM 16041 TaxID=525309 RepID=C8P6J1_9LACO|nr:hypothetical protein [Limosilactobacillus antri]EEW53949.1 hypothetical protein HMPREF0494_0935 [Limosilactobacillus antri DSM 16041]KRK60875.1 hypothetical protein FC31_GL000066 [Limosilactobacillus antri DSM 16041]
MGKRKRQTIKLSENTHFSDEFEQMLVESGIIHSKGANATDRIGQDSDKLIISKSGREPQTLDELRQLLNSGKRLLSLDFEFYNDPKGTPWIREIAGKQFGSPTYFQYRLFNKEMTPERQLEFLQEWDIPYSETVNHSYFQIRNHLSAILNTIHPDYVVCWGDAIDFNALDREEQRAHIKQKHRLTISIPRIDLARLVGQAVFQNRTTLSLEKMGKLLGIKGTDPRHVALNDVRLLDRILQFYARDLNEDLFDN